MRGRETEESRVCTNRENEPEGRKQILPLGGKKVDAHYILVGAIFWRNGDIY